MENPIVLGYWNSRNLAERVRLLLQYCRVPYTQKIYDSVSQRNVYQQDKEKWMNKNPAINLPYIIDGDKIISETSALLIYICHKSKKMELLGKTSDDYVRIATVNGVFSDFWAAYIDLTYGTYQDQKQFKSAVQTSIDKFQVYLKKLSGLLEQKNYFAGEITWVDFMVADLMQILPLLSEEYLKPFPNLKTHQKRIWDLPELKDYFSSERYKQRPCNSTRAYWR